MFTLDEADPGGLGDHAAIYPALVMDKHEADAQLDEELLRASSAPLQVANTHLDHLERRANVHGDRGVVGQVAEAAPSARPER